ncbi:hypothetical protein CFP56_028759 [Quercus suber]|uniref:Uncharacterized protein n=2 Tax=Quercus suber TaxID=58331 RepID=A0AAW0LVW2_QUESU
MFNLNKLNDDRPEVVRGAAWSRGQIPESPDSLIESLVQRVNRGRFKFEIGSSSNGPQLLRTQVLPTKVVQDGNSNLTMGMGHIGTGSGPNQEAYIGPTVSLDTGLDNLNIPDPLSLRPGLPLPISTCSNPFPLLSQQDGKLWESNTSNHGITKATRKRFRVEFGKLRRNIRQRLLCGFCLEEGSSRAYTFDEKIIEDKKMQQQLGRMRVMVGALLRPAQTLTLTRGPGPVSHLEHEQLRFMGIKPPTRAAVHGTRLPVADTLNREELEAEINKRKEEIENKRKEVEKTVDSQLKLSDHDSSNKSPVD